MQIELHTPLAQGGGPSRGRKPKSRPLPRPHLTGSTKPLHWLLTTGQTTASSNDLPQLIRHLDVMRSDADMRQ